MQRTVIWLTTFDEGMVMEDYKQTQFSPMSDISFIIREDSLKPIPDMYFYVRNNDWI